MLSMVPVFNCPVLSRLIFVLGGNTVRVNFWLITLDADDHFEVIAGLNTVFTDDPQLTVWAPLVRLRYQDVIYNI